MALKFGDLVTCRLLKKVLTDFIKCILSVKRSTLHAMLYGELGRYPVTIQNRIIKIVKNASRKRDKKILQTI